MLFKNFKNLVIFFIIQISTISLYSQKDVTQFLGIPVDGTKQEMIKKLRDKGFSIDQNYKDVLVGEFNGINVELHIVTNNNKVCRIMVCDANTMSERDIKIRFNILCQQFQDNKKYIPASLMGYELSISENISYEMTVNKKRYEAIFYQLPAYLDTIAFAKEIQDILLSKYTKEQLSNPTEELQTELAIKWSLYALEKYSKKAVWFMISEIFGKYYITMFYDNEYNRANGKDL